jgi:hypothetical protein
MDVVFPRPGQSLSVWPHCVWPHIRSGPSLTLAGSSLLKSCSSKCIDTSYREADLNKGESVCLDRCVAKFFEVNVKVSEKMQGEAQGRGGGGGGMFGGS